MSTHRQQNQLHRFASRIVGTLIALLVTVTTPHIQASPVQTFVDDSQMPSPLQLQVVREGIDVDGRLAVTIRARAEQNPAWIAGTVVLNNAVVADVETSRRDLDRSAQRLGVDDWYLDLHRRGLEGQPFAAPTDGSADVVRFVPGASSLSFGFQLNRNESDALRFYVEPGVNPASVEASVIVSSEQPTEGWLQSDTVDIAVGSIAQDVAPDDGLYEAPDWATIRLLHEDIDVVPLIVAAGEMQVGESTTIEIPISACAQTADDPDQDDPLDHNGTLEVDCTQALDSLSVQVDSFIGTGGSYLPLSSVSVELPNSLRINEMGIARLTISPPHGMNLSGAFRGSLVIYDDNDLDGVFSIGDTFDLVVVDADVVPSPGYEPPIIPPSEGTGEAPFPPGEGQKPEFIGGQLPQETVNGSGLEFPREEAGQRLQGGLCVCQQTRAQTGELPVLPMLVAGLLVLAVFFRRRLSHQTSASTSTIVVGCLLIGAPMLFWPAPTVAQEVDLSRLELTGPGGDRLAVTDFGKTSQHLDVSMGLMTSYGRDPLIAVSERDGSKQRSVVANRLDAVVSASLGLWDWVELGVAVPLVLFQDGAEDLATVTPGDPQAGVRVRLYPDSDLGFRLALVGAVSAPLQRERGFAGSGSVRGDTELIVGWSWGIVELALNAGFRFQEDSTLENISQSDELRLATGVAVHPHEGWTTGLEFRTATAISAPFGGSEAGEAFATARWHDDLGRFVTAYGGLSVMQGYGVPSWTAGLGFGIAPALGAPKREPVEMPELVDTDRDGLMDPDDDCPFEPEDFDAFQDGDGCPETDNDSDGFPDWQDGAPNLPEDMDGWKDDDGIPEPDNDLDGVPDEQDQCPNQPEDKDQYADGDGCPDEDNDGDGLEDWEDQCPNQPGPEYAGGCRP